MKLTGIDVSQHQGEICWPKVKKAGIQFAIIRCGYGSDIPGQDDRRFRENVEGCIKNGIPYGIYLYSYANSIDKAKSEAKHVIRLLKGLKPDYPVFYDLEDEVTGRCTNSQIAEFANIFCGELSKAGCQPGIYASRYWFETKLTDKVFDKWDRWVAQYSGKCTYKGQYTMWQFTDNKCVDGITGRVDGNECYKDYVKKKDKPAEISGDDWTERLQKELNRQFGSGLKLDGIGGPKTLKACPMLKRGARGNVTKLVQESIGEKEDGIFGPSTEKAVKLFQKKNALSADGIVGPETWKKLLRIC